MRLSLNRRRRFGRGTERKGARVESICQKTRDVDGRGGRSPAINQGVLIVPKWGKHRKLLGISQRGTQSGCLSRGLKNCEKVAIRGSSPFSKRQEVAKTLAIALTQRSESVEKKSRSKRRTRRPRAGLFSPKCY